MGTPGSPVGSCPDEGAPDFHGVFAIERHADACRGPRGGATHGPLEQDARIVDGSRPRIARSYAEIGVTRARIDLAESHGRRVAGAFVPLAWAEGWRHRRRNEPGAAVDRGDRAA